MNDLLLITKALADPTRLRALCALEGRELCVCQLIELLDLAPSTISKHLSVLKTARLVESRKKGRWHYYRLAAEHSSRQAKDAIAWILHSLAADPQIAGDREALAKILKTDPEELCRGMTRR